MNQTFAPTSHRSAAAPAATAWSGDGRPPPRVAVICSGWHREIVHRARDALLDELRRQGLPEGCASLHEVPGAFEIPLLAQRLARSDRVDAIIACGLVVDGGIYRHDFVAQAVIDALMRVQLDEGVPVFSAVLTPQAFHEHAEHHDFFASHFEKKGVEVARACLGQWSALAAVATVMR